jgi:D-alanine-D-alanine ligase
MTIAVLGGGRSSEHDVSLASAASVADAIDPGRYRVLRVTIERGGRWLLDGLPVALVPAAGDQAWLAPLAGGAPPIEVDLVFPVLHGPWGEDGTVQGLCDTVGVPYVGADVAASAVGMDKALFHVVATAAGIPRVETVIVMHHEWLADPDEVRRRVASAVGYPAFAKPARLGSSFGISPVADEAALGAALELAFAHDPKALVERRAMGREVEVGLLGGDNPLASPLGEILHDSDWYDHDAKYREGGMRLQVPADVPPHVQQHAQQLAVRAWNAIGCSGLARVDFFLEGEDLYISEINTIPGFTSTSVWGRLMGADGLGYPELVQRLIDLALQRHQQAKAYRG